MKMEFFDSTSLRPLFYPIAMFLLMIISCNRQQTMGNNHNDLAIQKVDEASYTSKESSPNDISAPVKANEKNEAIKSATTHNQQDNHQDRHYFLGNSIEKANFK